MTDQPTTGDHGQHLAAAGSFGINTINCVTCHVDNGSDTAHRDGTVDVVINVASVATTIATPAAVGGCGTNDCHNDGTDNAPRDANYQWGVTNITNCTECHGNDASSMASYAHTEHLNYTGTGCTVCHVSETNVTHINRTVNINGAINYDGNTSVAVTDSFGSCLTTNCHNRTDGPGADRSAVWNTVDGLACDDCHYYEGPVMGSSIADSTNNGSYTMWSLVGRHPAHFDKQKQCVECHTVPAAWDTDHINGNSTLQAATFPMSNNAAVTRTDMLYTQGPDTCSGGIGLGCHATGVPSWGDTVGLACLDCHTNTTTTEVNPTTGLHAGPLTISGTPVRHACRSRGEL
jgi:predicted CxxxxCH...CXXCH cytochrome family protein